MEIGSRHWFSVLSIAVLIHLYAAVNVNLTGFTAESKQSFDQYTVDLTTLSLPPKQLKLEPFKPPAPPKKIPAPEAKPAPKPKSRSPFQNPYRPKLLLQKLRSPRWCDRNLKSPSRLHSLRKHNPARYNNRHPNHLCSSRPARPLPNLRQATGLHPGQDPRPRSRVTIN